MPGGPFTVVAVIATAALLVSVGAAVLVTTSTGPRATGALTFHSARSVARSELGPGNWSLIAAVGYDLWNGSSLPLSSITYPPNCTVRTYPPTLPSSLSFPAYRGSLADGAALVWLFDYQDVANLSEAFVMVANGTVSLSEALTGSGCGISGAGLELAPIPANVVDSSSAAHAIDAAGADRFLAGNRSGTTLMMSIFGGLTQVPASLASTWTFAFTPCSGVLTGNMSGPANGVGFTGSVNATTGAVISASVQAEDCVPVSNSTYPPAIYQALTFGPTSLVVGTGTGGTLASQGCVSGDYCYTIPIRQAVLNVTPNDMVLWVQNATGVPSLLPQGYAFLDSRGGVLVYSVGAIESTWTSASGTGTTLLAAGDALDIDMGPSNPFGLGYQLNIQGEGPFANSGEGFSLP